MTCPEARFCTISTRPGFGLTVPLREAIGRQNAAMMLYTSRRISGEEALRMGLADVLVPEPDVRDVAQRSRPRSPSA